MWVWPSTSCPSVSATLRCLDAVLLAAAFGSASVAPSPPPSRLVPDQESTRSALVANIGASAVLTSASPVLPSFPPYGKEFSLARASSPATPAPGAGGNPQ